MGILQLIASQNFIVVNKELIKILGLEEAILIGELASECDYWERQDKLENGYFYSTLENVEENTTLTAFKQRKALNKLKELKLVEVSLRGIPAKRYVKINEEQVIKLFNNKMLKNLTSCSEKNKELEVKKINTNNNINNKNKNNNIYNSEFVDTNCIQNGYIGKDRLELGKNNIEKDKETTTKKFKKPTLEEVKAYCLERKNSIDAESFIDYYEANGWKVGRNSMKDWKAAVRTWEKRETKANKPIKNEWFDKNIKKEELSQEEEEEMKSILNKY